MAYFIILRGPAAVGKTTVAKALAKSIGAKHIAFDRVMAKHKLDTIEGRGISAGNFLKANRLIVPAALRELKSGRRVVFDGCFYRKRQLDNLVRSLQPYKHFVFTLNAPLEECIKRNSNRKKPLRKKDIEQVYALTKKVVVGIKIDTTGKLTRELVEEIKSRLQKGNSS